MASSSAASAAAPAISEQQEQQEPQQQPERSNRPPQSNFHQQKLPSWQPYITAGTVFPLFFLIAVLFISIGIAVLLTNEAVDEIEIDYTLCKDANGNSCAELTAKPQFQLHYNSCLCQVLFTLPKDLIGQVYAYYALTNFYQNHRKYVKSRDKQQLVGRSLSSLSDSCVPYRGSDTTGWVTPCGAAANSLFNDTYQLQLQQQQQQQQQQQSTSAGVELVEVPWTQLGISWPSDVSRKYGRVDQWNGTVKPNSWRYSEQQRTDGVGFTADEELQVWLQAAALPRFRKLHRIVQHNHSSVFANGLPAGNYTLSINYSYPVIGFHGTKRFLLSTAGPFGARNSSLGGLVLAVGFCHLILSILFLGLHLLARKRRSVDKFWGIDSEHRALLERLEPSNCHNIDAEIFLDDDDDDANDHVDDGNEHVR